MCTALTYNVCGLNLFGRNLDLNCGFGEEVAVTPAAYPFKFSDGTSLDEHYAMIGMATVVAGYPLYAEATNQYGLSAAGLNFPGNAHYFPARAGAYNVAPYELISWLLARYRNLAQVREILPQLNLTALTFGQGMPLAPLHWIVADSSGAIVIESTASGLHYYDNPYGVLTNNPQFDYHLENIKNYLNITAEWPQNRLMPAVEIEPVGVGFGCIGLPGDTSPASRFVRAAFLRAATLSCIDAQPDCNGQADVTELNAVSQFFHILDAVAMVKGSTRNLSGPSDYTVYSCCCNTNSGVYYYKTYDNSQFTAVALGDHDLRAQTVSHYPLRRNQQVYREAAAGQ